MPGQCLGEKQMPRHMMIQFAQVLGAHSSGRGNWHWISCQHLLTKELIFTIGVF